MAFDLFCSMNHFVSKHIVVIFKWPEEILIRVGVTSEDTLIARDVNASQSITQCILSVILKQ
jgi:hypothetical protein